MTGTEFLVRYDDGRTEIDWTRLLQDDIESFTPEEQVLATSILDAGVKAFESRLDLLKTKVRQLAGESKLLEQGGVKIQVTRKQASVTVNEPMLLALLKKKTLDPEHVCFQKVTAMKLDTGRLELAIAGGMFTDDEVKSFTVTGNAPAASVAVKQYGLGITAARLLGQG